jgi:hypothetical protein
MPAPLKARSPVLLPQPASVTVSTMAPSDIVFWFMAVSL